MLSFSGYNADMMHSRTYAGVACDECGAEMIWREPKDLSEANGCGDRKYPYRLIKCPDCKLNGIKLLK